ncbi:hypothetical protein P171DRAFT_181976 [Karstenula rhodostoma CBS 690.94]|uniref:Uncharacterized protein n=1 Tax=Karstenula rhodostoma CBS 690.94 TaxID=1392251 RepID=A0A9P4P321_9PLEO|nr:hypothetical protein P171DRAFT_181976 [Karstenula rhodostoma CBS 690.94]
MLSSCSPSLALLRELQEVAISLVDGEKVLLTRTDSGTLAGSGCGWLNYTPNHERARGSSPTLRLYIQFWTCSVLDVCGLQQIQISLVCLFVVLGGLKSFRFLLDNTLRIDGARYSIRNKTWIVQLLKPGMDLVHTLPVELLYFCPKGAKRICLMHRLKAIVAYITICSLTPQLSSTCSCIA